MFGRTVAQPAKARRAAASRGLHVIRNGRDEQVGVEESIEIIKV